MDSPIFPGLYPSQGPDSPSNKQWNREILYNLKSVDRINRRSSLFTVQIKSEETTPANGRRWSATEILKNWKNITIEANVEKEEIIEKLDSLLHNVPLKIVDQAKQARQFGIKCMWFVLAVLMHMILIYQVTRRSVQYYYNPIITTFALHNPIEINLPQIYICMAVSANRTFTNDHPKEAGQSRKFRERIVKINKRKRDINFENLNVTLEEIEGFLEMHDRNRRYTRNIDHSNFDVYEFFYKAGYKVEETFLQCLYHSGMWKNVNCVDLVEPVLDINYGLCYAVRVDGMKQRTPGRGVRLIINSHSDLYPIDDVNAPRSSGIYVSVSKRYDPSNWLKSCAAPGQYIKIDIKATHVRMMNLQSGSLIQPCIDEIQADNIMQIFNATYSITTCQLDCMLQEFNKQCQCILLVDKKVIRKDVVDNLKFCTPNRSQSCLVPNVIRNKTGMDTINRCRAKCHSPCDSWRYDMRTTSAPLYPPSFSNFGFSPNVVSSNLIGLDISFPAIEYAELAQSPSLTPFIFIGDIGGLVNLWMGASVLVFISVLLTILKYLICRILQAFTVRKL